MSTTRELVRFVSELRFEDLQAPVIQKAKESVLDQLGIQLIASRLEWSQAAYRAIVAQGGSPESTVVGYGDKTSMANAAFVNAAFGHGCEMDDIGFYTHPGCNIVPPAIAVGEKVHASGKQVLLAIVAGYEVENRLGLSCGPSAFKRGFHDPFFVFGSVAAAGKLLGLNLSQMSNAFGIAGSYGGGITEYAKAGGEVKRLHPAIAAHGGITAAQLAHEGFTGPPTVLEGDRGFLQAFADEYDLSKLTWELGHEFTILQTWFKAYACCGIGQPIIEAVVAIIRDNSIAAGDIDKILVHGSELWLRHIANIYEPKEFAGAQFSLPYALALTVNGHKLDLATFMNSELWRSPVLLELAHRVYFQMGHEMDALSEPNSRNFHEIFKSRVELSLRNGKSYERVTGSCKGMPSNPMSREEILGKFLANAGEIVDVEQANRIADLVDRLDTVEDIGLLGEYLAAN